VPPFKKAFAMVLLEILDFEVMQRNVKQMKLNAKRQANLSKVAQARLKIQQAQQELNRLLQSISSTRGA
jgi:hypothetical protein